MRHSWNLAKNTSNNCKHLSRIKKITLKLFGELKVKKPKRYGWVIGIREDKIDEYKRLHANAWPDVIVMGSGNYLGDVLSQH